MQIVDLLSLLSILLISVGITIFVSNLIELNNKLALIIFVWHTASCFVYWEWSQVSSLDANYYYLKSLSLENEWGVGSKFVVLFTSFLTKYLYLNKLNVFLVYNIIGVLGLLLLAHMLVALWKESGIKKYLPYILIFFPGLSFWTSSIGKDGMVFFGVCLAMYSMLRLQKRIMGLVGAIILVALVRPHIASILLASIIISLAFGGELSRKKRIVLILSSLLPSVALIFFSMEYVGIENTQVTSVIEYVKGRENVGYGTAGFVDISQNSIPVKMLEYIFMPITLKQIDVFSVILVVENILLVGLCAFYLKSIAKMIKIKKSSIPIIFTLVFFVVAWVVLSMTTTNLGLAARQKTMLLPALFILIAYSTKKIQIRTLDL